MKGCLVLKMPNKISPRNTFIEKALANRKFLKAKYLQNLFYHFKKLRSYESRYSRMDQVKFVEGNLLKIFTWPILEYLDPYD